MLRVAIAVFFACCVVWAQGPELERAQAAYQRTAYDDALQLLAGLKGAAAEALRGKAHYGQGDFKRASEELEKAVEAEPGNASYWHWLGRAFGRRAENSSFLTAPRYASRCRNAFEKAVELDPKNLDAIDDLFTYYMEAPGIMGGGRDKAAALAETIKPLSEAQYLYSQAELAKKSRDWDAAEQHLRNAAELEPGKAGHLVDLARLLESRGRFDEADALFRKARELEPDKPAVLFDTAAALIESKRSLAEARRLLGEYLKRNLTPDDPPRREAQELLERANR